jgi:hypothetical protein
MTMEPGSVIEVNDGEEQSGFVDVSFRGQIFKVFARDIEKGADRVEVQYG